MNREQIEKCLLKITSCGKSDIDDLIVRKAVIDLQESYDYVVAFPDQDTRLALERQVSKAVRAALREYRNIINNL